MPILHLGPVCAKKLIKRCISAVEEKKEVNLNEIVQEALKEHKRWCVMMGEVAIKNETKALKKIGEKIKCLAGARKSDYIPVHYDEVTGLEDLLDEYVNKELVSEDEKFENKDTDKKIVKAFKSGGNKAIDILNKMSDKDKHVKQFFRRLALPVKNEDWSSEILGRNKNCIISIGAGGFKGGLIQALSKNEKNMYRITYPTFKWDSLDDLRDWADKMRDVPLVVNSLFCFAGSAKYYKRLLRDIEEETDETFHKRHKSAAPAQKQENKGSEVDESSGYEDDDPEANDLS